MQDLPDELFLVFPEAEETGPSAPTLSLSNSPVVLVTFVGNQLTRKAASAYQKEFGIGVMDWRMLVMLTQDPGCSVGKAAQQTGIDKAAVSRSLHRLESQGLAQACVPGGDDRRKSWSLTEAGQKLHNQILPRALQRQRQLLDGFSKQEVEQFTTYLQRFLANTGA